MTVFRRSVLAFLGLVLGFNVYLMNAQGVGRNQMPMPFGVGLAVVQSGSMEPTFSVGDLICVQQAGAYTVGDIVVYQSGSSLVVHRIVAKNATMITAQGDANNTADEPVETALVLGKVVGSVPVVGYVFDFLKTPVGWVLVAATAVLLVELSFRHERKLARVQELLRRREIEDEIRWLKAELAAQ